MKILHTADWHLGAYVGPQCDDPMKRMENTIKCLDTIVETARREQPDIILIVGDIFHQARVWSDRALTEVKVAANYINTLGKIAPVTVLYGTPNHDGKAQFDALSDLVSSMVVFYTQPAMKIIETKSGFIQVAGLPGFDKGHFRAQFPGLSAEEENRVFTQQLANIVQGLSSQLDPNFPSVLMAHHTVVGCELDNGQHVFQANEVVLDAATIDNSAFDLVCLGHIHRGQCVGEPTLKPIFYSGSIDATNFNEEEHIKGFWIHDIDHPVHPKFVETPAREFFTALLDQNGIEGYMLNGLDKYADYHLINKVVRVLYSCDSETEKALDKKKLERDLYAAGAYYVSEIRPESITAAVNRERMTEKMTEKDCLEKYLLEKKVDDIGSVMFEGLKIIDNAQASSPIGTTSGLFLPVEIEVHNYRSYADEKFSFEDIFFAMVNGKNGSGKSSLFMDAITDCLYEETRENELTGWIRNGEKSGSIIFTFRLGDDLWRVTRTRQRSGKATLALARATYGGMPESEEETRLYHSKWQDHSCERLNDTQQKVIDLLGMDCDTFQSCVLIMQDQYGKFMEASKEERMTVLANLLGLGIYDQLSELTKEKLKEANREIRTFNESIANLEAETADEENLHTELLQVQAELETASDDLKENKDNLASVNSTLGAMAGYEQEASHLESDLKSIESQHTEKKNRRSDLMQRITETETFLQGEANISAKCEELDAARLEIAAMDGKLQLLSDKQQRCRKANTDLESAKQLQRNTANTIAAIQESLKDKERLESYINGNTIEQDLEECERKAGLHRDALNKLDQAKKELDTTLQSISNQINIKQTQQDAYARESEMLRNSECIDYEKATCRFLQSAKEARSKVERLAEEVTELQKNYIQEKDRLTAAYDAAASSVDSIGYNQNYHNTLLSEIKTFRASKDKMANLAAASATLEGLRKQYADTEKKIQECEGELAVLGVEIAQLSEATNRVTVLKTKINSLLSYEQLKMELPKARQFVESSRDAVRQLDADIDDLMKQFNTGNNRLTELKAQISGKSFLQERAMVLNGTIAAIEGRISTLNQRIGTIQAGLQEIDRKKDILAASREGLQAAAKKAAYMQILVESFSQDGIPYQIIRDIVPELEASANEILGQMTGGRMRMEFVTEKVQKSNKAKEIATLEIIITDIDHGTLPYLSRSGGQKVRAALAVNFALAMIKASRVGLQLGMMFVDEPPFLDADGIDAYCSALEIQHEKYPEMRILAISHDENMKARFPQQITIETTDNGSRVRRAS